GGAERPVRLVQAVERLVDGGWHVPGPAAWFRAARRPEALTAELGRRADVGQGDTRPADGAEHGRPVRADARVGGAEPEGARPRPAHDGGPRVALGPPGVAGAV